MTSAPTKASFGLPNVPVQPVLVDGAPGVAGTNADEVTLDIELQIALAPGASRILVYETGGTDADTRSTAYSQMAEDDIAKQISTSWGLDEPEIAAEHDPGREPDLPADGRRRGRRSTPRPATAALTTRAARSGRPPRGRPRLATLRLRRRRHDSDDERSGRCRTRPRRPGTAGRVANGAGGGGVSTIWPTPTWQQGGGHDGRQGARRRCGTCRTSALNAEPEHGLRDLLPGERGQVYGGTSCAAPLWAAFTALVNQQRTAERPGAAGAGQPSPVPAPGRRALRDRLPRHQGRQHEPVLSGRGGL